jgi:hypothetical protein
VKPIALAAVLLATLSGCGAAATESAEDFEGEEAVVAVVVDDLVEAARDDEPARICDDLLAPALLATLRQAGTDCEEAVADALDDADSLELEVREVRVSGDEATAEVVATGRGDDEQDTLEFVRAGSEWRIASLGAGS